MRFELNKLIKILLIIVIIYLCFISLGYVINIFNFILALLLPFLISFSIGFLLQPIVKFFEKRGISKKISCSITLIIIFILLISIVVFIVPIINKQFTLLISKIPSYVEVLEEMFINLKEKFSFLKKIGFSFSSYLESFNNYQTILMDKIVEFIKSIFSYFIPIVTTPILIIYFTFYYDEIEQRIKNITHNKTTLYQILKQIKDVIKNYFKTFFLIIIILSIICSACFGVMGLDYFLLWGILIGVTDIIPYIGPYIGGAIVGLFVLSTNPNLFVAVVIVIVCIQILEGYYLTPKIQGKVLQINPILVIFSVTFFGKFLGIFGMLIAVPITRIVKILVDELIFRKNH